MITLGFRTATGGCMVRKRVRRSVLGAVLRTVERKG